SRVTRRARLLAASLALVAAVLAGCSGGSGPAVEVVPGAGGGPVTQTYTGPAPSTADVQAFKINLWDNIHADNRCGTCHSVSGGQTPLFARSDDVNLAYEAAKPKMDLDDPANSRFVLRLRNESHNCWSASCTNDANAMQAAITNFAAGITPTTVDPNLFTSKATTLYEGTIASGGHRDDSTVIAMYEFKTGQTCGQSITGACATAYDTSGVDPAMDLTLSGNVQWFGGWGLNFAGGKAQ